MRAVIYARYSSENQHEASIEDQVRNCRRLIEDRSWNLGEVYADRAISGVTSLRPDYQRLLAHAREKQFDVVVAEGLDRLSRDPEATAGLYKLMTFLGIAIVTRAEGGRLEQGEYLVTEHSAIVSSRHCQGSRRSGTRGRRG